MKNKIDTNRMQEISEDLEIKIGRVKKAMDYCKKNQSLLDNLQENEKKETKYTTTELRTIPLLHAS